MDQIYKLNIFTGIYCVICRENLHVFEGWIQSHSYNDAQECVAPCACVHYVNT